MGGRASDDLEQIRFVARDAVDFDDLVKGLHGRGEAVVIEVRRAVRAHERRQRVADASRVELGGIVAHEPACLEPLHAVVHRRRLQSHQCPQLGIGRAGILLQGAEQAQIDPIEFGVRARQPAFWHD